ncbi:MAG: PLP-dependent aminotransferase family protein [Spirochaetales bacterium]|nr:PLP-dependent aminotransferase family protein [Spirochaetales bacterium]
MNSAGFLYERIVSDTQKDFERGIISPGDKLPSLREIAKRYGCSVASATRAYEELEIQGCVQARQKSGYYALELPQLALPRPQDDDFPLIAEDGESPLLLHKILESAANPAALPLGAGLPHESLLPLGALSRSLSRCTARDGGGFARYSAPGGHLALRERIAALMRRRNCFVNPQEITITNGCTGAMHLAIMHFTKEGDTVAVESPVYPGILQMLHQTRRRILPLPTSPIHGVDREALHQVCKTRQVQAAVVSAVHQNPLGFVMDEQSRKELVHMAGETGVPLIEDDIYGELGFQSERHAPIKAFDEDGHVVLCSSFSKTLAPGMRIGWICGGKEHQELRGQNVATNLGPSPLMQAALADYLDGGGYFRHLGALGKALSRQKAQMRDLLAHSLPKGTCLSSPAGGYYLWVELPKEIKALTLFHRAHSEGIGIAPGPAFSSGSRFQNCIRISFGTPITEETKVGISRLGALAKEC